MRSVESDGETIDEAIENALRTLQVERDRVEIEILSDAARGLFGFGGRKARVRATVRPPLGSRVETEEEPLAATASRETTPRSPGSRPEAHPAAPREQPPRGTAPMFDAFGERCRAVLTGILSHLAPGCTVEVRAGEEPGVVVLDVSGDSGGLLIGRRGQTLDALEYIVKRIVARGEHGSEGRVRIDVEHYRERRREHLEALARRLADKVRQTGRVVTLNPMSPRDRRIVHLSLQGDSTVVTRSQGEGQYRKVLILPAERVRRGGRNDRPAG